jgi:flagellar biosynthetic protein FliP
MIKRIAISLFLLIAVVQIAPVMADTFTLDMGTTSGSMMGRMIQLLMTLTIMALAPSLIMMVTSFTRIVVVFSFIRNALGTQQSPPNMILLSLAMFLTFFIMSPTFEKAYNDGIHPLIEEKISEKEAFERASKPFQTFMLKNVREKDLHLFASIAKIETLKSPEDMPLRVLVPAFIISELKRAFEIGFLIFIPFLIIDMVISSILMSMGMMMLPPVMISMPFKLIFFVLVDGWYLLCGSLVNSFR